MFNAKDLFVRLPCRLRQFSRFGTSEEVATRQRETAALATLQFMADHIFPVCGMQRHFPDVVPTWSRAPSRLLRRDSLQRLPQVCSMPGFFLEGLFKQAQNRGSRVHFASTAFPRSCTASGSRVNAQF